MNKSLYNINEKDIKLFLDYIKKLNYALGNGTLKTLQECNKQCELMVKLAGDIDANLKQ